ncbi:MAG TPA: hypothetical protein PLL69_05785 [Gemmatimonadales bacterium]|nr:hypothetical protein [Gemmatimonadales bacterium]
MTSDEIRPDETLSDAIAALRAPQPLVPGLIDRATRRRVAGRRRNGFLAGAPLLTAMLLALGLALHPGAGDGDTVTFALVVPDNSSGVSLVGDFTDWQAGRVRMEPAGEHRWEVKVQLPPGRYRYAYVTDEGEWLADASAAPAPDDFESPTSVITVLNE